MLPIERQGKKAPQEKWLTKTRVGLITGGFALLLVLCAGAMIALLRWVANILKPFQLQLESTHSARWSSHSASWVESVVQGENRTPDLLYKPLFFMACTVADPDPSQSLITDNGMRKEMRNAAQWTGLYTARLTLQLMFSPSTRWTRWCVKFKRSRGKCLLGRLLLKSNK